MKSLQGQIVWKVMFFLITFLLASTFIISYFVQKKSELYTLSNIEYIRDTKYSSLNKDNLSTAFSFDNLNFVSYILNEKGELTQTSNFRVDQEVKDFCSQTNDNDSKKYTVNGFTKYIAIKKNGLLCFVVEGNTNNSILLGQFTRQIMYYSLGIFFLFALLVLRFTYKKVYRPVIAISQNTENALVSKWDSIKPTETKIGELASLDKFTNYLIEMLKQRGNGKESEKAAEIKDFQEKFLNKKLTHEANKFKLAVDSAVDIIVVVDKFGYINYINNAVTKLIGISYEEAENKKITDIWHTQDDVNLWKQNYEKVSKTRQPIQFSSIGIKKSNLKFESLVQITPIANDIDSVENFLVVERDVTEERQKERIKTEFISVVSHELRTPMTVIRGYSTLLSEGKLGELNDKQKEYVNKINTETGQLLELANDMLDIQKFESGKIDLKLEKVSIPDFIQKIVLDFAGQFNKKGLELKFENNLKNIFANIDQKYFARVVTNLLTNAYKYTEKGEVKVFLVNPDDHHIVIAVKDTGIGIKEEALNHLFERFYQADGVMQRKQEGSGLGLSIVKTVTESHNGMVWVESKLGVGSTFYVAIPIAA